MSGAVDHQKMRLAIRFIRAWSEFDLALTEVQQAGLDMGAARDAAAAAFKAVGVEAPSGPGIRAQDWADAVSEYEDLVHGYCESCERPKLEADVCTGATDEDGDIWVCQACVDRDRPGAVLRAASPAEAP